MESKSHHAGIIPLTAARFFEGFGYNGIRALFMSFLMESMPEMHSVDAARMFTIFMSVTLLLQVFGGLVGDLLLGNKRAAVIGGFLQAFGCFIIAVPATPFLYTALVLIGLGNSLFQSNLTAQLKILYTTRKKATESAMQILYIGTNLGAYLGSLMLAFFSGNDFFVAGFIILGCMFCVSSIVMLASQKITPELSYSSNVNIPEPEKAPPGKTNLLLVLLFVVVPVFWLIFHFGSTETFRLIYKTISGRSFGYGSHSKITELIYSMYPCFTILLGILFAILWFYTETSYFSKIAIGFLLYAIACSLLLLVAGFLTPGNIGLVIITIFLMCLVDLLISPTVLAFICNTVPRKFCGTFIGLYFTLSGAFGLLHTYLIVFSEFAGKSLVFLISMGLCMLFAILFIVLHFAFRERKPVEQSTGYFNQFQ